MYANNQRPKIVCMRPESFKLLDKICTEIKLPKAVILEAAIEDYAKLHNVNCNSKKEC